MIFQQRTLGLALAGLLLGAALNGCGDSGDPTSSQKKPRETTFRSTRAPDQDLQGEKPYLSLRALEVPRQGQKSPQQPKSAEVSKGSRQGQQPLQQPKSAEVLKGSLQQPKSAEVLPESRPRPESFGGKRGRKIAKQTLQKGPDGQ
jgi:hypothetical protein